MVVGNLHAKVLKHYRCNGSGLGASRHGSLFDSVNYYFYHFSMETALACSCLDPWLSWEEVYTLANSNYTKWSVASRFNIGTFVEFCSKPAAACRSKDCHVTDAGMSNNTTGPHTWYFSSAGVFP